MSRGGYRDHTPAYLGPVIAAEPTTIVDVNCGHVLFVCTMDSIGGGTGERGYDAEVHGTDARYGGGKSSGRTCSASTARQRSEPAEPVLAPGPSTIPGTISRLV